MFWFDHIMLSPSNVGGTFFLVSITVTKNITSCPTYFCRRENYFYSRRWNKFYRNIIRFRFGNSVERTDPKCISFGQRDEVFDRGRIFLSNQAILRTNELCETPKSKTCFGFIAIAVGTFLLLTLHKESNQSNSCALEQLNRKQNNPQYTENHIRPHLVWWNFTIVNLNFFASFTRSVLSGWDHFIFLDTQTHFASIHWLSL